MKEQDIQGLLKKLTSGNLSEEEAQQLQQWYQAHGTDGIQQRMDADWAQTKSSAEIPAHMSWEQFKNKLNRQQSTPVRRIKPWMAIAASIALLIIAGLGYFQYQGSVSQVITVANTSFERQEIALEDGSVIWLNSNSSLTYTQPFDKKGREITLQGEAFFEVATDSLQPFIVKTDLVETKVLGTSFNVKAFPEAKEIAVSLVEGQVQVRYAPQDSIILYPGEQFSYDKQTQQSSTATFIGDQPYAWKDQVIYFYKNNVNEVVNILTQWYDVTFAIQDTALMETELVHRVDTKKRTLKQVLEQISSVADYTFEMKDGNQITVKPKLKK